MEADVATEVDQKYEEPASATESLHKSTDPSSSAQVTAQTTVTEFTFQDWVRGEDDASQQCWSLALALILGRLLPEHPSVLKRTFDMVC